MEILYADDRVIVCIKPAGVLSTDEPGGMPELLCQELGEENAVIRTVHRLDRVVSGVMVYTRTSRAAADLESQMRQGSFQKEYLAVVQSVPLGVSGTFRDLLWRNKQERKTYVVNEPQKDAQEAVLEYRLLDSVEGLSLVAVKLHTGRTHQIRCQFAHRGMPLIGDKKYGGRGEECGIGLWSYKIAFLHPRTNEKMEFLHNPPEKYPWSLFLRRILMNEYEI